MGKSLFPRRMILAFSQFLCAVWLIAVLSGAAMADTYTVKSDYKWGNFMDNNYSMYFPTSLAPGTYDCPGNGSYSSYCFNSNQIAARAYRIHVTYSFNIHRHSSIRNNPTFSIRKYSSTGTDQGYIVNSSSSNGSGSFDLESNEYILCNFFTGDWDNGTWAQGRDWKANEGSFTITYALDSTPPNVPAPYIDAAASSSQVKVSDGLTYSSLAPTTIVWNNPGDTGISGVKSYLVTVNDSEKLLDADPTSNKYQFTQEGDYQIKVKSKDGEGNESAYSTPLQLKIDYSINRPTFPTSPIQVESKQTEGKTTYNIHTAWNAVTDISGVRYQVALSQCEDKPNDAEIIETNDNKYVFSDKECAAGHYYVYVKAIDGVSNASDWVRSDGFDLPVLTPITRHNYTHDGQWVNQPVTINLTVTGGTTGITTYYKIDNGTAQSGDTISIKDDGIHTVNFWSVNSLGRSETPQTLTVKLDQGVPEIFNLQPKDFAILTSKTPSLSANIFDSLSGVDPSSIQVTLDGAAVTGTYDPASDKVTYIPSANLTSGSHTWKVSAKDLAGNQTKKSGGSLIISDNGSTPSIPSDPATVAPALDSSVVTDTKTATSFLYTGDNPIQHGVDPKTIVSQRAAVIRGKVLGQDNQPLSGVEITILDHSEYGYTFSRTDGMFDLAINGGGYLTVKYEKDGYLSAQRQVNVPWQDYEYADEVMLVPYDTKVTAITPNSTEGQIAQSSVVSDDRGERQATLFFPAGTTISGVSSGTVNVRATEFTVGTDGPKKMPAALPATSAYTYCVDLSVDGASSVQFSQPVYFYVDNFLNFPVGGNVPTGYYNEDKGVWVPSVNGVIIQILSVTDGLANIDVAGSGTAADAATLSALGFTDIERKQLATTYAVGKKLWRVPISHFSKWDCNWGWGPPDDAIEPNGGEPENNKVCDQPHHCYIERENQVVRESTTIPGTPFTLNYSSERAAGRIVNNMITIPLSGTTVPSSLKRIVLEVDVAGQQHVRYFSGAANQTTTFAWDGKDSYGRTVAGSKEATVTIGFVYAGVYKQVSRFGYNGNGITITGDSAAFEVTLWKSYNCLLNGTAPEGTKEMNGWSLNVHHTYDPINGTLYNGNGEMRTVDSIGKVVQTIAGGGTKLLQDSNMDLAQNIKFNNINGITAGPDGCVYLAAGYSIWKIDQTGKLMQIAGSNQSGHSGDGGPATDALLGTTFLPKFGSDGSLYFYDSDNSQIRKINKDGIINTVITNVTGVSLMAVGPDGSIYVEDNSKNIYQYKPDGSKNLYATCVDTRIQGAWGESDSVSEGTSLNKNTLPLINALTIGKDGSVYLASECKVWKVTPDGIIHRITGQCWKYNPDFPPENSGDGGPAIEAKMQCIASLDITPDNTLYITTGGHYMWASWMWAERGADFHYIRYITPDGIIHGLAGRNNSYGFAGDEAPAMLALLQNPTSITYGPDNVIYFIDSSGQRIRKIYYPVSGFTSSDILLVSKDGNEIYQFDSIGRHLKTLDAATGKTIYTFGYDSNGKLTGITDCDGNVTTIAYSGSQTVITAPFGQQTTLITNGDGYLQTLINPANETRSYTYDNGGLLTGITDPKGQRHKFSYDALGLAVQQQNPDGGSITLEQAATKLGYQVKVTEAQDTTHSTLTLFGVETLANGDIHRTTVKDGVTVENTIISADKCTETATLADGTVTTITKGPDPHFRVFGMQAPIVKSVTVTTPGGKAYSMTGSRSVSLSYADDLLSLQTQTDTVTVNGKTSTRVYDVKAKTVTTTSPEGRKTVTTLDDQGRVSKVEVPGLMSTSFTYDPYGRLTRITSGSRVSSLAYNSQGYVASTTDPLAGTTSFEYDAVGRVVKQFLPNGKTIAFSYDSNGNVTGLTPPDRNTHGFTYNAADLTDKYNPPVLDSGATTTQYGYNLTQQPTLVTRPDGQTVGFSYDTQGRLVNVILPDGTQNTYGYDATSGNLTSLVAADGETLTFGYDGSLPTLTTWSGTIAGNVGYTYDDDFKVTAQTVNGENSVGFTYDKDGLLTGAGDLSIIRNADNGMLTGTTLGNVTDSVTYNDFGEVTNYQAKAGGGTVFGSEYTYDGLGRIATKNETVDGKVHTYEYSYDELGQLTDVKQDGVLTGHYKYDANGNRTGYTGNGVNVTATTYDEQDRMVKYGSNTYQYTANGELTSKTDSNGITQYGYDVLGNLQTVTLSNKTKIEYVVDGANRRIGKKVNGTLTQGYLYQDGLNPVAELDSSGNVVSRFVYGTRANVPDYMIKGGVTYRIISDHLGSVRLVVNASTGDIVQKLEYDEFGKVLNDSNPGFQPYGYAGGMYDKDTGLVRFGARDYDAETGRWTCKDPIAFNGGDTELYGYVQSDPINFVDPNGKEIWGAFINAGVSVANRYINDKLTGHKSSRQEYIADAAVGFVGGLIGNPWLSSGVSTVLSSVVQHTLCGGEPDAEERETMGLNILMGGFAPNCNTLMGKIDSVIYGLASGFESDIANGLVFPDLNRKMGVH